MSTILATQTANLHGIFMVLSSVSSFLLHLFVHYIHSLAFFLEFIIFHDIAFMIKIRTRTTGLNVFLESSPRLLKISDKHWQLCTYTYGAHVPHYIFHLVHHSRPISDLGIEDHLCPRQYISEGKTHHLLGCETNKV